MRAPEGHTRKEPGLTFKNERQRKVLAESSGMNLIFSYDGELKGCKISSRLRSHNGGVRAPMGRTRKGHRFTFRTERQRKVLAGETCT